jgi:hypothetical protein
LLLWYSFWRILIQFIDYWRCVSAKLSMQA